jgi:hypothetical protein
MIIATTYRAQISQQPARQIAERRPSATRLPELPADVVCGRRVPCGFHHAGESVLGEVMNFLVYFQLFEESW